MIRKLQSYFRQHTTFHLPYVAEKFDITLKECVEVLCELWNTFDNPQIVDNLLYTNYPPQSWWYEVCDTPYKRGKSIRSESLQDWWVSNQKENQHVSTFAHDKPWKQNAQLTGSVSCKDTQLRLEYLWIELDRKDYRKKADFQKAIKDGLKIKQRLDDHCEVFTSGNNSTHIVVDGALFGKPIISQENKDIAKRLAHSLAGNVRFGEGKNNVYQYNKQEIKDHFKRCYPHVTVVTPNDAKKMVGIDDVNTARDIIGSQYPNIFVWDVQTAYSATENIDPNIYNVNSLIRQPWSVHESGGHRKVLLSDKGSFQYGAKKISFPPTPPKFLDTYFELWEQKPKKKLDSLQESSYFIDRYSKWYPDIKYMKPDQNGYVGPFHSVLYDDSKPSVYINTATGHHHDFGSQVYSLPFEQFLLTVNK